MPLRPRCLSEEEEGKAEEEEKEEAKTEVEGTVQQILKEGGAIQISIKAKVVAGKVVSIMLKDRGMISPMSNVTTVKKYGYYANECRKKQQDMANRTSANFTKENSS